MKIIDNFLERSMFDKLQEIVVYDNHFPLFYTDVVQDNDYGNVTCEEKYNYQLGHTIYKQCMPQSEAFSLITPILDKLKVTALVKAKLNFNPGTETHVEHGYHVDVPYDCLTAIYYLNTNNGYSKFETGEVVESIENRVVIFNSGVKHTGSTCTDKKGRYVLNLNFYSEKY